MLKALLYVGKNCRRAIQEAGNIRHFIVLINLIKFLEYVFMVGSPYFYAWIMDGAASLLGTQPEYDKLLLGLAGTFGAGVLLYVMISYQDIWALRVNHSITSYMESSVMLKTAKIHFNNLENAKTHEIISKVRSSLPSDTANFATNSPVFSCCGPAARLWFYPGVWRGSTDGLLPWCCFPIHWRSAKKCIKRKTAFVSPYNKFPRNAFPKCTEIF